MNRPLPVALICVSLFAVVACQHDNQEVAQGGLHGRPTVIKQQPPVVEDEETVVAPSPTPASTPAFLPPAPPAPKLQDLPYGVPVQSKPGYVTSPYAPDSGYVDVRGFAPGQEVRDPYTNKVFLVP